MREGTCWQVDTLTREAKKPCKGANRSGAPVQKCKSERGEAARGHVDKVTRGQALARGDMLARGHGDMGRDRTQRGQQRGTG